MNQKIIVKKQKAKVVKATTQPEMDSRDQKAEQMVYDGNVTRVVPREMKYEVGSQSNPTKKYEVKVVDLNEFSCSCPDFEIRSELNPKHQCKHIRLVKLLEEYSQIKQSLGEPKHDF